jgi:hypothetical protein
MVDFQFKNIKNYDNISPIFSIKTNNWKQRALIYVIYVSVLLLNMAGNQSESEKFECCCKNRFDLVWPTTLNILKLSFREFQHLTAIQEINDIAGSFSIVPHPPIQHVKTFPSRLGQDAALHPRRYILSEHKMANVFHSFKWVHFSNVLLLYNLPMYFSILQHSS